MTVAAFSPSASTANTSGVQHSDPRSPAAQVGQVWCRLPQYSVALRVTPAMEKVGFTARCGKASASIQSYRHRAGQQRRRTCYVLSRATTWRLSSRHSGGDYEIRRANSIASFVMIRLQMMTSPLFAPGTRSGPRTRRQEQSVALAAYQSFLREKTLTKRGSYQALRVSCSVQFS